MTTMGAPFATSHSCARCGAQTAGIAVGGLCPNCTRSVELRASRLGRWVALGSTALLAAYLSFALRAVVPAWRGTGRAIAAAAVVAWCLLTYRIVKRIGIEWLK
ncbi:MAG: hypothetical protein DMD28_08410 [Gemmatimonadetes bacterium]|nr:MAG: hypothetical protein DMD28_08410 [Gemmatimonadota bacterium]